MTMKAIQQYAFGGPDVLRYEDAPVPALRAGEVLVRVHAVGLNPPDWYLREGYKTLPPEWRPEVSFPLILGTDISGVIAAVADDVTDFSVGEAVYSMVRFPEGAAGESRAYAQYVSVPASQVARKPARLDHLHAAAAPMSLLTAWQFMIAPADNVQNPLQPDPHQPVALTGKTVLINGAAGGASASALSASTASAFSFSSTRLSPRTLSRLSWLRLFTRSCSSRESGLVFGRPGRRSFANRSNVVRSVCSLAMI